MPGYKTHCAGGFVVSLLFLLFLTVLGISYLSIDKVVVLIVISLLASIFPDVDTNSKAQDLFYGSLVILDLVLIVQADYRSAAIVGFVGLLPALGHHRGWTHSWWAMLLIPAPILLLPMIVNTADWQSFSLFYGAALFGYGSHLVLDKLL